MATDGSWKEKCREQLASTVFGIETRVSVRQVCEQSETGL